MHAVLAPMRSSSSGHAVVGSTVPRLWTRPLVQGPPGPCGCGCALTPDTSYGFDVEAFAGDVLELPLDPWERWLVIHAGELLPDGRPRFRKLLAIVARQNGKTHLLVVLSLFWLFVEGLEMMLGTSTKLDYAKESWRKAVKLAKATPALRALLPATRNMGVRQANGEQELETAEDCRYKIAPANAEGGRSLTLDRAILDELRQHHSYAAWDAIVPATNAVPHAQVWAISNQGDSRAVVLTDLRAEALAVIDGQPGDERLGLFEWSAPDGAPADSLEALAQANPNLGRRLDPDALLADARAALRAGGEKLTGFQTEILCQRVNVLDPAIDPTAWKACGPDGDEDRTLDGLRARVAACIDVSLDGQHVTLLAAAVTPAGAVRLDVVQAWQGPAAARDAAADLPALVARVRPRALGWFPGGPAASLLADLAERRGAGVVRWPPAGVKVEAIRDDVAAACMGLAELVAGGQLEHPADPLLDAHVAGAERLWTGDRWRFVRRGAGHCDAAYAAAGAVLLARTLPAPVGRPRVVTARRGMTR